jgi:hypothetical protein
MVDVRLLYPAEKTEAAARLEDALEAAGYGVERKALGDALPDLAAEGREARVLLLIWSRGLVSAAMADGGLGEARRRPNLIEVSVDGIEPTLGAEVSPVVLLSGWRGQPFHLGWQRILGEIERLCGSRVGAGRKATPEAGSIAAPVRAGAASKPARPVVRAAFAAGALIAATLGAAAVLDRGAADPAPPAATRAAGVAMAASPGPGSPARQEASPVAAGTAVEAAPAGTFAAEGAPAATPVASRPERRPSANRPARRPAAEPRSAGSRRLASAPEVKRYSRKHSKTMRLFCQRSGRSTPQCRSFARSMRALRG